MKRSEIIAAARAELGTPYVHQGRRAGLALDCLGLVVHVARGFGLPVVDKTNYDRWPDTNVFLAEMGKQMQRIELEEAGVGDIVVFNVARRPQHLGFVSRIEPLWIVHSYAPLPVKAVVEVPVPAAGAISIKNIHSAWRLPGLEEG